MEQISMFEYPDFGPVIHKDATMPKVGDNVLVFHALIGGYRQVTVEQVSGQLVAYRIKQGDVKRWALWNDEKFLII